MRWLPIESAPKDGTAILVCYADQYDSNGFLPIAVRWRNYHPNSKGKEAFRLANGNKVEVLTHWMPLPPPPSDEHDGLGITNTPTPDAPEPMEDES